MGWDFFADPKFGKKEVIADLLKPANWGDKFELLGHRVVGNNLWTAVERTRDDGTKYRFIALDLLQSGGKEMGWGSKGLSENMGPCEVDCPLALLDLMGEPETDTARAWRAEVREFHAARKVQEGAKAAIVLGQTEITLYGKRYLLQEARYTLRGRANGYNMVSIDTGKRFRITPKQMNEATIHVDLAPPAKAVEPAAEERAFTDEQMALPGFTVLAA